MGQIGIVFIHGAGLGGWVWDRVRSRLEAPTLAVDLPERGDPSGILRSLTLEDYVRSVMNQMAGLDTDRYVLVGHSIGGEIALRIATLLPDRVAGLVFVSAVLPPSGKSMVSLEPRLRRLFDTVMLRFLPAKPPPRVIRAAVCNDLDEATCAEVLSRYSPESHRIFLDRVEWRLPKHAPRVYVKTLKDKSLLPPLQDLMLSRLEPAQLVALDSGHYPMLSRSQELAEIIETVYAQASIHTHVTESPSL